MERERKGKEKGMEKAKGKGKEEGQQLPCFDLILLPVGTWLFFI